MSTIWGRNMSPLIMSPGADADRAGNETAAIYDAGAGSLERDMARRGINPGAGQWAGLKAKYALKRAAAVSGARTRAHNAASERSFNRLISMIRLAREGGGYGLQRGLFAGLRGGTVGRATQGNEGGGGWTDRVNKYLQAMGGAPLAGGGETMAPDGRIRLEGQGMSGRLEDRGIPQTPSQLRARNAQIWQERLARAPRGAGPTPRPNPEEDPRMQRFDEAAALSTVVGDTATPGVSNDDVAAWEAMGREAASPIRTGSDYSYADLLD